MRIWSLHPKYLDCRGLVALWREALLAQAVLMGETKGYTHHPQLARFRKGALPVGLIAEYLRSVHLEAESRGYCFAAKKISSLQPPGRLAVSRGQLDFEWRHLTKKLEKRNPAWLSRFQGIVHPEPHPLFRPVRGGIAEWEKTPSDRNVAKKRN
ncbi:MAG: DNA lyase [Desulfobacteraceae bacterium]|nr:MAG: DNA lyase [Desulfobacteraceae bacterium]